MNWPLPNITPRAWQVEAFAIMVAWLAGTGNYGLLSVVMGAGKSILMKALSIVWTGRVVITAPTKAVADQLGENFDVPVFHSSISAEGRRIADEARVTVAVIDSARHLTPRPNTLLMADEAHRADTATFREVIEVLEPVKVFGLTATARKGTKALGLWEEVLYSYRVIDALRDNVIVPWKIMPWTGGRVDVDEAARHFASLPGAPGLINARDIKDAEAFASSIESADVVHSRMKRQEIQRRLRRLETGEINWMVHVSILAEGFDMPILGRYIFRANVGSPVSFAQQAGRVLRKSPGKEHAIFYDPLDIFENLGLGVGALLSGGGEPELSVDYDAMLRAMGVEPPEVETKKRRPKKRKARALGYLQVYFRQLAIATREVSGKSEYRAGPWRRKKPSDSQKNACVKMARSMHRISVPPGHLRAMRALWDARGYWDAGNASDWMDTIMGLRRSGWTGEIHRLVPDPGELCKDLNLLGIL